MPDPPRDPGAPKPQYTRYRARPRLGGAREKTGPRPGAPDGRRSGGAAGGAGGRGSTSGGDAAGEGGYTRYAAERGRWRIPLPGLPDRRGISPGRVVRAVVLFAVAWIALSVVVFLVSAFVHKDSSGSALRGAGVPPFTATTILVLGSDARVKGSKEPGAGGPSRADSILLMRVGGGHAARLSIPRDTAVPIPGHGTQKINAAYAFGGTALMARTVTAFTGIRVDHVVEVSFARFPQLIDAMGGVTYTGGCVVSRISGGSRNGGYTLRLKAGRTHIDGKQALALARTRHNDCNARESDLTRARRQQKLFSAMKSRLLSPGAFVRLPFISWSAPKALRSDMGGPTLLGVFAGVATGGSPQTRILKPTGAEVLPDGGDALTVSPARVRAAARRFLTG